MSNVLEVLERVMPPDDPTPTSRELIGLPVTFSIDVVDVTPIFVSRTLHRRPGWTGVRRYRLQSTAPSVHPGTAALEELKTWLALPLDTIVGLVELSPSARAWWRSHPTAPVRPDKAGRLLRFRAAVGLLVGHIGAEAARQRLHGGGWLEGRLTDARLAEFEALVHQEFVPALTLPPRLAAGLTAPALDALRNPSADLEQQRAERAATWTLGPDAPA